MARIGRFALFSLLAIGCGDSANSADNGGDDTSSETAGSASPGTGGQSTMTAGPGAGGNATSGAGGTGESASGVGGKGGAGQGSGGGAGMSGSQGSAGTGLMPSDGGMVLGKPPFDWVGIIGTGQSLSVGWEAGIVSPTQPFKNIKLLDQGPDPKYPIDNGATGQWSVTPLIEPIRKAVAGTGVGYDDSQYPNNIFHYNDSYGETPHSGMANTLSTVWAARGGTGDYITAHSVVGWSGHCLTDIDKKGGKRAFPAGISEARIFKKLADAQGKTYGVGGIVLTHGECDSSNPNYETGLYQLWQDYNTDLKTVTGQTRDVVLLISQQSSIAAGTGSSAVQVWKAGNDHPGQIVCTGPKYAFGPYGLHLPGPGYERVGEKYAEVFDLIVNQGIAWKPVGPNKVTRNGAVITLSFDVPNPPLVWDTNLNPPHQTVHTAWAKGKGFEVIDAAKNEVAIASVEIQGSNVILTLAQAPAAGTALTVGYALTPDADGYVAGGDNGMHGQLRDSDPFEGYSKETIEASVTNGSPNINDTMQNAFIRRAALDIVTGSGLPAGTVAAKMNFDQITLSSPWTGPTGKAMLTFHHNHYNYAVHFAMAVP
jgi:hypothetical protein